MTTAVRSRKIGTTRVTTIIRIDNDQPADSVQLGLFDDPDGRWYADTIELAMVIPSPFYGSDLRRRCGLPPRHDNMWGALFQKLIGSHKVKRTGNYRRSPIGARRGGIDWEYERI